jgi:hypothetical protein
MINKSTILSIHDESILKLLKEELPSVYKYVRESKEEHYDNGRVMYYTVLSKVYRYFVDQYRQKNTVEVQKVYKFVSELILNPDPDVSTLGVIGFLELINSDLPEYDEIKKSMPPLLQEWMKKIEDFWGG